MRPFHPVAALLVLLCSSPAFAGRVDINDVDIDQFGDVIAQIRETNPDGQYLDGSRAVGGTFFDSWFSEVRFDGAAYTYVYGMSRIVSCNCGEAYNNGYPTLLGGELLGGTLEGTWGTIFHVDFFGGPGSAYFDPEATAGGITFVGELPGTRDRGLWFYVQVPDPPRAQLGTLVGHYQNYDARPPESEPPLPPFIFYSLDMDALVPVPEPGTLLLVGTGGLFMMRHARRLKSRRAGTSALK